MDGLGDDALTDALTDLMGDGTDLSAPDAAGDNLLERLGLNPDDIIPAGESGAPAPAPAPAPPFGFSFPGSMAIAPQQPPSPPSMAADIAASDWAGLQLIINQHSVHKVEEDGPDKIYVVSNLRKFKIEVALVHRDTQPPAPATENQLQLRVRPLSTQSHRPAHSATPLGPNATTSCPHTASFSPDVTPRAPTETPRCVPPHRPCCCTKTAAWCGRRRQMSRCCSGRRRRW